MEFYNEELLLRVANQQTDKKQTWEGYRWSFQIHLNSALFK